MEHFKRPKASENGCQGFKKVKVDGPCLSQCPESLSNNFDSNLKITSQRNTSGGILIEVPTNTLAHGAQRSGVVTLMGGQASTSGSSTMQVKSVYIGGGSHQGMGLNQGSSSAPLTNASLVELGKQLLSAAREGDKAEVSRLLAKGAPMTTDWLGTSPLHLAAQYGHQETAEILLRSGCQRDARTKVEKTPLHVAAQEGHDNVAELLLSNGADIDMVDMLRMTPLHWAVDRGHISMVETLLRFGADISIESKFGQTPLEIASDSGRPDIFEMLQNADQFGVTHSVQSEAATFAATQSIISEEFVDLEDSVSPIAEEELIPDPDQTEMSQDNDQAEAVKLLAAHGITLLPEDSNTLDATGLISDPSRTFALTEAGKIALGLTKTTSLTNANSSSGLVRKPTTITRIVRLNTTGLTGAGLKTQSNNSPKIIKVTPEQFAALKAGNSAKLASIPGLQSATSGLKRNIVTSLGNSEQPLDHRGNLKIVRVNPSISIQPKKPTTSASIAKPGIIIKSPPPTSNVTKTVVVTSASESLKRQLEESQKLVEQMSEKLRQQEAENAKLKKLLEEHLLQTDNEI